MVFYVYNFNSTMFYIWLILIMYYSKLKCSIGFSKFPWEKLLQILNQFFWNSQFTWLLWKTKIGAMTVSSEMHGKCIYSLPCSRRNQRQPSKYKITQNTRQHKLQQEKERVKGEEEEKRLGTRADLRINSSHESGP